MKPSRFTEEQIIRDLAGAASRGEATICAAKTGSAAQCSTNGRPSMRPEVSDAEPRKALEDRNAKLKKLAAEAMLSRTSHRKMMPAAKREDVGTLRSRMRSA